MSVESTKGSQGSNAAPNSDQNGATGPEYEFYGFTYVFPNETVLVNEDGTVTHYYEGPDGNADDNPQVRLFEHGRLIDTLSIEQPQNHIPANESFLNSPKK